MNAIMAKIAKTLFSSVSRVVGTSNFVPSSESAFVRSARAKSLNQLR